MSEASALPPALDPADVDAVIQAVRFELYRENIYGGLEMLEAAQARRPDARYAELSARIRAGERPVPIEQGRTALPERIDGAFEGVGRDQQIEILVHAEIRGGIEVLREHRSLHDEEGDVVRGQARAYAFEVDQHPQVGGRPRRMRTCE